MKFTTITILILLLGTVLAVGQGSSYRSGTTIRIDESDSLSTNLMAAGRFIEHFGYINDDFYSASEHLMINGEVKDDAIAAARAISITGTIGDMFVGVGETVIIDGIIRGDLFAAGATIEITENAHIHGNVAVAAESIIFSGGQIDGWLLAAGEQMKLNGKVNRFVELYGNSFTFESNYNASYGTTITSTEEIHRENLGIVPEDLIISVQEPEVIPVILFKLWFYVSLLITGSILILLFRQTSVDMHRFAIERIGRNTGVGFLVFLLAPPALLILLLLIFTVPLAVLAGLAYGIILFLSYLLVALVLGVTLLEYFIDPTARSIPYWGLAVGLILIAILTNIPFIGWLLSILLLFYGLGSFTNYLWNLRQSGRNIELDEKK